MADGTRRPSNELARTTSNSQIDTSAPFENVKAARNIFETGGEKSKIPMPPVARTGSAKSGDWLSKQQGFVSPRSRANSFEERQRAATVASPNSATSEFKGYVSPPAGQKGEKLEVELKAAQVQLEEAQTRATALQQVSTDEEAKRASLQKKLAEYHETTQQLEEKLAREQADHSAAKERAETEMQKLRAALEKSQAGLEDKTKQVAAALSAMQTTADAHSDTQDELAAVQDELAAVKAQLAEARSEAEKHTAALATAEKRTDEAKKEAAAAVEAEERARAEVAAAQSEVELAKKTNATLESRLEAAAKELELAQHAAGVATKRAAEEQAAREKDRPDTPTATALESRTSDVAIYAAELSRFQGRIVEAEALADKRVAAATAQLDASRLAEEETKAKLDALSADAAAAKSAESSLREKLEAALAEAEQAKRALQAESDRVHDSGVSITIAQAKEKEAVEKLAVIRKEREALQIELSELRKKSVAPPSTGSVGNGEHRAHKDRSSAVSVSEIQQENAESATVPAKPLTQQEPAKPLPQQEPAETKSQPKCCIVM